MLLALDISLTTGAAWGNLQAVRPHTAVINLPDGTQNFNRALVGLREWVAMTCRFEKVTHCIVEAAMRTIDRNHSDYSAFLLTSLSAVAREAACRAGVLIVEPAECEIWRRHFIGSGHLPGPIAKAKCLARCDALGYTYQDHNAAEACGVWHYGMNKFFGKPKDLIS